VVIAVVGLLMGLLWPALSAVRAEALSTQCRSNLRQMAIAAQQHATLRDEWPAAILYRRVDTQLRQEAWDWVSSVFGGELISPGPLWTFTDDPGSVMQCPAYHGPSNFSGDAHSGYNYNTSYIGAEEAFTPTGDGPVRAGVPPHACQRGSTCVLFGDGGFAGGANKFMRAPGNPEQASASVVYSGGQAFRHRGTTNASYIDGHVGPVLLPRAGAHATPTLLEQFMDFPRNGFLSDDDAAYDPR
ncbi:MAG: pilus assembly FimT family protein, partial [Planctomycetota bacterium]